MLRIHAFLLAALLAGPGLVAAQATKVVPASAAAGGGNTRSFPPFVVDAGLMQQLIDGSVLSVRSVLLREIAYRKDQPSATYQGRRIGRLIVRAGSSRRSPATMSTSFAANRSSRMVVVFNSAFNLPTQVATPGRRPWNIVLKFPSPFVYLNVNGNLLLEVEMPGKARTKFFYPVDGYTAGSPGKHRTFGSRGPFRSGDRYNVFSSLDQLRPGGEAVLTVVNLKKRYPALAIYGLSNTKFGTLPLPLDLRPLGAPGNFLHVSMDVVFPFPLRQVAASVFTGRAVLPLPDVAALAGRRLYGQALFADPTSNRLGFVFSNGVETTLGGGKTAPLQTLHGLDTAMSWGGFVNPGRTGGPVLRLTGMFN